MSTLLAVREVRIKSIMRYHYTFTRMVKLKKKWQNQMLVRMQRNSITYTLLGVMLNNTATLEYNLEIFYKTRHATMWPSNNIPGIYSIDWKLRFTHNPTHSCSV